MLPRKITSVLRQRLDGYPAVALVGPRQCGKTTLARSFRARYYDLEQETDRLRLDLEWSQVQANNDLVILDEAQEWPEVFPMLRGAIDAERKRNGRFLLLGSVSPALMRHVSESLAGRLSVIELSPFSLAELETDAQRRRRWLTGGYADGGVLGSQGYIGMAVGLLKPVGAAGLAQLGIDSRPSDSQGECCACSRPRTVRNGMRARSARVWRFPITRLTAIWTTSRARFSFGGCLLGMPIFASVW